MTSEELIEKVLDHKPTTAWKEVGFFLDAHKLARIAKKAIEQRDGVVRIATEEDPPDGKKDGEFAIVVMNSELDRIAGEE